MEYTETIPEIWAVGGGKGGTGKSFLACNLATSLALKGKKVILMDLDLGGPNLHSFLRVPKQAKTLVDFFQAGTSLDHLSSECGIDNLRLIQGSVRSFQAENIKYFQKVKLFNHIRKLGADIVLLDLGAGTHFNSIDSFLLSNQKIVVTLPQKTALENMYTFLKNAFIRALSRAFVENGLKHVIDHGVKHRKEYALGNISQFLDYLRAHSEPARVLVDEILASYCVNIVVNGTRTAEDITLGNSIKSVCIKHLNFRAKYTGYIENDDTIPLTAHKRYPYVRSYPRSKSALKISRIADNLLNGQQMKAVYP